MSRLILENRSYLIFAAHHPAIENQLKKIGEKIGFRLLKVQAQEKLEDIVAKVKNPVALISDRSELDLSLPHFRVFKDRYFEIATDTEALRVLSWLHQKIREPIPLKLLELMENAIQDIAPRLLGTELGQLSQSDDYEHPFTNLVTCDSSANHFSAKASCEVDFGRIRTEYSSLRKMSDSQLVDLFGEICNQTLGSVNFRLRSIGLDSRISLPMGVELRASDSAVQVDYMPMLQLTDKKHTTSICIAVKVESQCPARWDELVVTAADGEVEFF